MASSSSERQRRGYRSVRRRTPLRRARSKEKELELNVSICIEEDLPDDPEILVDSVVLDNFSQLTPSVLKEANVFCSWLCLSIVELLLLNVPLAMKLAFEGLKDLAYKTRDTAVDDVGGFQSTELSVLLCNDNFIRKLNKEWRDEDHPTDVLSMSQHVAELHLPILMFGDIVISIETAQRQAEESGHTLLDEVRSLMACVLNLHSNLCSSLFLCPGFYHELREEAEAEMEKEEGLLLKSLGWQGNGLIQSAQGLTSDIVLHSGIFNDFVEEVLRMPIYKTGKGKAVSNFISPSSATSSVIWMITSTTAQALREALLREVKIVIATGKTRPAVINIFKTVTLVGKDGVVSELSAGVFLQAVLYSHKHQIPLIAFCEDRCLTLFVHPMVDSLHTVYSEPKAEIISSVEDLLSTAEIQKMIFLDTAKGVATNLHPHWAEVTGDRANVIQAEPDMLEVVPPETSKGGGVRMLLDHLGITAKEIMAIGDGENDIEMLDLASLALRLAMARRKRRPLVIDYYC